MGIELALGASALIGGISSMSQASQMRKGQKEAAALNQQSLKQQAMQQRFNEMDYIRRLADYEKLKSIYGPLQEDIGTYFANLTGEKLSNDQIARIQQASQKAQEQIHQQLAQSGRSQTGLEDYLVAQNTYQTELAKAQARQAAEKQAIDMKMNYLGMAQQQANSYLGLANQSMAGMQTAINNQGNIRATIGNQVMATNAQIGNIYGNYADQLTSLIGFKYRLNQAGIN